MAGVGTGVNPTARKKVEFHQPAAKGSEYITHGETATMEEKMKILKEMGKPELIELFKEWRPRPSRRRRTAPLDQRVTITVTDGERISLDGELKSIKAAGERITASQFIRNRALGAVDIHGWRAIAVEALARLDEYEEQEGDLRKRKKLLANLMEEAEDEEDSGIYEMEIFDINKKLAKLSARSERRNNRLSGRMSLAEAETVKWRAQRLCIAASDYLRMQIFGLAPDSHADAHMSLDSKRRFYISIIDVANNGWGEVPTIYQCTQCGNYLEEIERLRDRIKQLETFG